MLEHVLSEELEELIAAKLGNPTHDPARRPDPDAGADDRGGLDREPSDARGRRARDVHPRLGLRAGHAPVPRGARDRARRRVRGDRQAAIRRTAVRPLRRGRARPRRRAGAGDARRGDAVDATAHGYRRTDSRGGDGRRADGASRTPASLTPLDLLLQRGRLRAHARHARSGVRGRCRVRRSGQLRDEHPGRRQIRLRASVGRGCWPT